MREANRPALSQLSLRHSSRPAGAHGLLDLPHTAPIPHHEPVHARLTRCNPGALEPLSIAQRVGVCIVRCERAGGAAGRCGSARSVACGNRKVQREAGTR